MPLSHSVRTERRIRPTLGAIPAICASAETRQRIDAEDRSSGFFIGSGTSAGPRPSAKPLVRRCGASGDRTRNLRIKSTVIRFAGHSACADTAASSSGGALFARVPALPLAGSLASQPLAAPTSGDPTGGGLVATLTLSSRGEAPGWLIRSAWDARRRHRRPRRCACRRRASTRFARRR